MTQPQTLTRLYIVNLKNLVDESCLRFLKIILPTPLSVSKSKYLYITVSKSKYLYITKAAKNSISLGIMSEIPELSVLRFIRRTATASFISRVAAVSNRFNSTPNLLIPMCYRFTHAVVFLVETLNFVFSGQVENSVILADKFFIPPR